MLNCCWRKISNTAAPSWHKVGWQDLLPSLWNWGGGSRIASIGLTTLKTKAAIGEAGGDDMTGSVEQGTAASETNTPPLNATNRNLKSFPDGQRHRPCYNA